MFGSHKKNRAGGLPERKVLENIVAVILEELSYEDKLDFFNGI